MSITKVVHSESKTAWNIVGTLPGSLYKYARIPYHITEGSEILSTKEKYNALELALFLSKCINNKEIIEKLIR